MAKTNAKELKAAMNTVAQLNWSVVRAGVLYDDIVFGVFRWDYSYGISEYKIKLYRKNKGKSRYKLEELQIDWLTTKRYTREEITPEIERLKNSLTQA